MTVAQAGALLADGQFDPGSMAPKIEAIIQFLEAGGPAGLITDMSNMQRALVGEAGTHFRP